MLSRFYFLRRWSGGNGPDIDERLLVLGRRSEAIRAAGRQHHSLMRLAQNSFEGQAEVNTDTGKRQSISVHVKYDGTMMF
jgi:hypothetical protein